MTRERVQSRYKAIAANIADAYGDFDVPPDVQHFFLLTELIWLADFDRFIERYGRAPIDVDFAAVGKEEFIKLGPLTRFERDTCEIWNRHLANLERGS